MVRVAVKIGPTCCEQLQLRCDVAIPIDGFSVVIWMIELDCIKAGFGVGGNMCIDVRLSGMSKRHQTACGVHDVDHFTRWHTASRNERGAIRCQPSIERLPRVGDITGSDHRPRNLRSPHRTAALLRGLHQQRSDIDRHAKLCQAQC